VCVCIHLTCSQVIQNNKLLFANQGSCSQQVLYLEHLKDMIVAFCVPLFLKYPQKLALASPKNGCRSVGIVRSLIKDTEYFVFFTQLCSFLHTFLPYCLHFLLTFAVVLPFYTAYRICAILFICAFVLASCVC
jgi:hypothetical protein